MALTFNGKVFRNLQEQVQYITLWLSANSLANEMGIKTLGRVDSEADLPANDPDHPFQYGDAYMVGEKGHTPYRMSIWTRDAGDGNPGWFDIGYFPTAPDQFSLVEINGQVVHIFNADTKLDKQTGVSTYRKLYMKEADGTQSMIDISTDTVSGSVVSRDGEQINVPSTPANTYNATSKKYVDDNFVAKATGTTSYKQAYIKLENGTQGMASMSSGDAGEGFIVLRAANAQINLPDQSIYTPGAYQAISKSYADAHYGSGLVNYLHSVSVELTLASGDIYPFRIDYIDTSSTPITSFYGAEGKLMTVYPDGQGEHSDNTSFNFTVRLTTGTLNPYGNVGNGFILKPTNDAEVYIGGTQSTEISSQSVVDTVSQL